MREDASSHVPLLRSSRQSARHPVPPPDRYSDGSYSLRSGAYSVTSSEAMRKLGQLEDLLERERGARRAAEDTLRVLMEEKKNNATKVEAGSAQQQLDTVMSTLRAILGDDTTAEQLVRLRRAQRGPTRTELKGKSLIDELGEECDSGSGSARKAKATAKRTGFTVDHRGGLHFVARGKHPDEASQRSGLPPLAP